jgi:hypothetical protein
MKKLFIFLLIIFCGQQALRSQNLTKISTWYEYKLIKVDTFGIAKDTFNVPTSLRIYAWLASKNDVLYIWSIVLQKWVAAGGAGGGSVPVNFADILGTATSNASLLSAFNAKQNSLPVGTVSQYLLEISP